MFGPCFRPTNKPGVLQLHRAWPCEAISKPFLLKANVRQHTDLGVQKWGQAEAEAFCVRFPIAGKRANTQIRVDISWDLLQMPRVGMH